MLGFTRTTPAAVWVALFIGALSGSPVAQSEKWGKVTEEEWNCPPPSRYPGAEAAVLFDNGQLEVSIDPARIKLQRHTRIKIFNKNAADEAATVELVFSKEDRVVGLKAQTILRDGRKISVEDFFEKKTGDVNIRSFTFPAVEDGCILEYCYSQSHQRLFRLEPWYFQSRNYTFRSRLAVALDEGFTYNVARKNIPAQLMEPKREDHSFGGEHIENFVWTITDILPLKDEPVSSARLDNLISLQFRLMKFQNQYVELDFDYSWEELGEMKEEVYKEFLGKSNPSKVVADSVCLGAADDQAKLTRLYHFVRDGIETRDESEEDNDASKLLTNRRGAEVEKNLLLWGC